MLRAVWQLWDSAPTAFEFDSSLLLFLLESVYSARFGSFLVDRQRDRLKGKLLLSSNTISVWSYIDANARAFAHDRYNRLDATVMIPLLPRPDQVKLWTGAHTTRHDTIRHDTTRHDTTRHTPAY
jgi:hypothetical protein